MISCLSFGHNFLKKKNKQHNILCYYPHLWGLPPRWWRSQLTPDPASPKQTSLYERKPQNRTNTHQSPHHNPISTMTPYSIDEIYRHSKQDPPKSPHTLARRGERMNHDDCACCVARCLWSVCAILISLGISFHILLPANAIVFWKFGFPLQWINYYYWQI